MLDQILKFIGSFVTIGGFVWFISYNFGTAVADMYDICFDKRKFTPEEFKTQEKHERANRWKFRFFVCLVYFSAIISVVTIE